MDKEYYILALNNNDSKNPMKIDSVLYKGEEYNLPYMIIEAVKEAVFESIPVLAVKSMVSFRDVITGEVIVNSNTGLVNGLSYYKAVKAKREDIIKITSMYRDMSIDDIRRYKEKINKIKEKSIKKYKESIEANKKIVEEETSAREFLNYLQNCSIN